MEETIIRMAGLPVRFLCYSKTTIQYLKRYLRKDIPDEMDAEYTVDSRNMDLTQESLREMLDNPHIEYCYLMEAATDVLMDAHRCMFHGVAFVWQKRAWILTAPSGTGKSTQFSNLVKLYGEEVFCLNGDKPCLEIYEDGSVNVYDSPWRGKEGWGTVDAVFPLAGIFVLKQSEENKVQRLSAGDAIVPIYCQFFSSRTTESFCHKLFYLEKSLIRYIPIYLLENRGDFDSTKLLYRTIERIYYENNAGKN